MKFKLANFRWIGGLQCQAEFDIGAKFNECKRAENRLAGQLFDVSTNEQCPKCKDADFHPRQLEMDKGDSGFNEIQKVFTLNWPMGWQGLGMSRCLRLYVIFSVYN